MDEGLRQKFEYIRSLIDQIEERFQRMEELTKRPIVPTWLMLEHMNRAITSLEFLSYSLQSQVYLAEQSGDEEIKHRIWDKLLHRSDDDFDASIA